jgi:hypothetical protein
MTAVSSKTRYLTGDVLENNSDVISIQDLNTDDFDLNDGKIVIKDSPNRAVPIAATSGSYTSTINNAGDRVEMSISDVQWKSSFEMTPSHILLNAQYVDFQFTMEGDTGYFRLKFNNGSFVYSVVNPSSLEEKILYEIDPMQDFINTKGINCSQLKFRNYDTSVSAFGTRDDYDLWTTNMLVDGDTIRWAIQNKSADMPNYYLPSGIPGTNNLAKRLGMNPTDIITVNNIITVQFQASPQLTFIYINLPNFHNLVFEITLTRSGGESTQLTWEYNTPPVNCTITYKLEESPPNIQLEPTDVIIAASNFQLQQFGVIPLYTS